MYNFKVLGVYCLRLVLLVFVVCCEWKECGTIGCTGRKDWTDPPNSESRSQLIGSGPKLTWNSLNTQINSHFNLQPVLCIRFTVTLHKVYRQNCQKFSKIITGTLYCFYLNKLCLYTNRLSGISWNSPSVLWENIYLKIYS